MQYNDIGIALNALAREQMKDKLMADIRADIEVCKLEGIDYKEYLQELKSIIDGFMNKGGSQPPTHSAKQKGLKYVLQMP